VSSALPKTALTSLELFLLELIKDGANTPYLLKEKAGVSVGAALPALNRLAERGLIRRGTAAARNKQESYLLDFSFCKSPGSVRR
jgi:hypothetical protein